MFKADDRIGPYRLIRRCYLCFHDSTLPRILIFAIQTTMIERLGDDLMRDLFWRNTQAGVVSFRHVEQVGREVGTSVSESLKTICHQSLLIRVFLMLRRSSAAYQAAKYFPNQTKYITSDRYRSRQRNRPYKCKEVVMFHALPIRILIADDHLFIREGLAAVLGRQPDMKIVAQAADGEEAINLFRLCRPDVSLMDLRMPGIDGIEATRTICEEFPLACILLFTTYCDNTEVASVLRAGAKGHLLKESSCEELLSTIRSVHSTA